MNEWTQYEEFIFMSRYARYIPAESRRETWPEAVKRYFDFFKNVTGNNKKIPWVELEQAVLNREIMPSMRALMTAGPALERDNVAGYNCAYAPVDHPRFFDEAMYILMCGTGVGFSVERQFINRLPEVAEQFDNTGSVIRVSDSKVGWAKGTRELLALLWQGQVPEWDLSAVRPAGERLKVFGGRASGPEPLDEFFRFAVDTFRKAAGRKLNSLEVHDLVCKIADVVVCGGVRRSALLSLSNLTDQRMRHAKTGQWWLENPQRALANNSVCYTEKPDMGIFMEEWKALYESRSGERGMFSREACRNKIPERRDANFEFGTNPCSEIILRPDQFCNLSEVVVRRGDDMADLERKVRLATILGTLQATLTDFRYLRKVWTTNTEEERLLGVSITGVYDHQSPLFGKQALQTLRSVAVTSNEKYAKILGIAPATAITCNKPSGTVSQLVNCASGVHPRYAPYYIRRVRQDNKDPLTEFLKEVGIPNEPDFANPNATVFSFPVASPKGAVTRHDVSALDQLKLWKQYNDYWCEHKPSVTIYVKEDEWMHVGAWLYENFDSCSGVSFLPYDNGTYRQAPYEEIDRETYERLQQEMPEIPWQLFVEEEDNTSSSQELACTAGVCEL